MSSSISQSPCSWRRTGDLQGQMHNLSMLVIPVLALAAMCSNILEGGGHILQAATSDCIKPYTTLGEGVPELPAQTDSRDTMSSCCKW